MKKILVQRLADWLFERGTSYAQAKMGKIVDFAEYKSPELVGKELAEKFPDARSAEFETARAMVLARGQMHAAFSDYINGLVKPLMENNPEMTVRTAYKLLADQGDIYAKEILESGLFEEEIEIG